MAKLDAVGSSCGTETESRTAGPYYFDVDSIRSDLALVLAGLVPRPTAATPRAIPRPRPATTAPICAGPRSASMMTATGYLGYINLDVGAV
ncbi:hypothetical protein [Cryobacterium sp. TMT1-2-2]|uniref:hypothetical protein n=1 Tax=Cryobacterium sp. TMT1-2-2 TaxID=1259233 RepID=UPI0015809FF3|nr:hypothetical protein [Cryobacterium sp. TMT1-2-2]